MNICCSSLPFGGDGAVLAAALHRKVTIATVNSNTHESLQWVLRSLSVSPTNGSTALSGLTMFNHLNTLKTDFSSG